MQQKAVTGKTVSEQGEESGGPVSHTFYPQAEPQVRPDLALFLYPTHSTC